MNSYEVKDGVIYIRDFKRPPDYFRDNGFAGIRKAVFAEGISEIPRGTIIIGFPLRCFQAKRSSAK